MNNVFVRRADLDRSFEDMHRIRPSVSINYIDANKYCVKLDKGGKSVLLTEIMDRGLTKSVSVVCGEKTFDCISVFEAEKLAAELLK